MSAYLQKRVAETVLPEPRGCASPQFATPLNRIEAEENTSLRLSCFLEQAGLSSSLFEVHRYRSLLPDFCRCSFNFLSLVRWLNTIIPIPFFPGWCKVQFNHHLPKNSLVLWI